MDTVSILDAAATGRLADFKARLIAYKEEYSMSNEELAEECEVSCSAIRSYITSHLSMSSKSLFKIHLATGIPM